ncbi:diguanylate cyclase [compost metagenome]
MSLGTELTGVVRITVSIGIACTTDCRLAGSCSRMVDAADKALYEAKRQGRNQIALAAWPPGFIAC